MKKLMIAAAIVCAAALSQAASVQWKTDVIKTPDTEQTLTKSRVNVYYYVLNAASDDLMALCLTEAGTGDAKTWTVNSGYSSSSIGGTLDGVLYTSGALTVTDKSAYQKGDTAYGVILITREANGTAGLGVGDWYMIAQASQAIESDFPYTPSMADLKTANWVQFTGGSEPVPEPTSGLLLLLGVAGLALRRKQK